VGKEEYIELSGAVVGELQAVLERLERGARYRLNMVFIGESGKVAEHLARHVHELSGRAGEFVAVDCETLSDDALNSVAEEMKTGNTLNRLAEFDSVLKLAGGGTLFLDRVEALSLVFQGRLSDMLDVKGSEGTSHKWGVGYDPVDVRVIATSAAPLKELAASGAIFERLYYQLDEYKVDMRRARAGLLESIMPHYNEQVRKSREGRGGH
jgi:transcriptional regulator of acetoin/glycerol metabolism